MTDLQVCIGLPILVNSILNGVLFLIGLRHARRLDDKIDAVTGGIMELDDQIGKLIRQIQEGRAKK